MTHAETLRHQMLSHIPSNDKVVKFYVTYKDGRKEVRGFWKNRERVLCVLAKRSRTRGMYAGDSFLDKIEKVSVKNVRSVYDCKTYRRRFKKAYDMLERTGLWDSIKDSIKIVLEMSDERFKLLCDYGTGTIRKGDNTKVSLYDEIHHDGGSFNDIKGLGSDLCFSFFNKKCFVTPRWGYRDDVRKRVARAIEGKQEDEVCWVDTYDNTVSVHTHKGELCATYAEEYRGTGNGHYYLLFDATHAIHYEDD